MSSNAYGERLFSIFKRVKSYPRNSTTDTSLYSLVGFAANFEMLNELNIDDIIDDISMIKARKGDLSGII